MKVILLAFLLGQIFGLRTELRVKANILELNENDICYDFYYFLNITINNLTYELEFRFEEIY